MFTYCKYLCRSLPTPLDNSLRAAARAATSSAIRCSCNSLARSVLINSWKIFIQLVTVSPCN